LGKVITSENATSWRTLRRQQEVIAHTQRQARPPVMILSQPMGESRDGPATALPPLATSSQASTSAAAAQTVAGGCKVKVLRRRPATALSTIRGAAGSRPCSIGGSFEAGQQRSQYTEDSEAAQITEDTEADVRLRAMCGDSGLEMMMIAGRGKVVGSADHRVGDTSDVMYHHVSL
jgi:hypothetical protein